MNYAPYVRIIIRYVVGIVIGADAANVLAADPEIVTIAAAAVGAAVEFAYELAKRKGWAT